MSELHVTTTNLGAGQLDDHGLELGDSIRVQTRGSWVATGTVDGATELVLILAGDDGITTRVPWGAIDTLVVTPNRHPGI